MVKDFSDASKLTVTVETLDGTRYENCDITSRPMGSYERVIGFWHNDVVRIIPLHRVKYFEYIEEKGN